MKYLYKILYKTFYITIISIVLILLFSCSTKKNTFSRRLYHNITSHYNAYWNGNESFKEGVSELSKSLKDNYNDILHVYNYGTKKDVKSIIPNMDRGIEKASKVIQNHSMLIGGKEYCNWIDDSYMLIGKCYFYKQEYGLARKTFDFVIKQYKDNPIKYKAMLWLAKTYNQKGEFQKAESLLSMVQNKIDNNQADRKLEKDLSAIYANCYILQKNYKNAAEYLLKAIQVNNNKDLSIRLKFILAQIYQKENYLDDATEYYTQVIKMNPPYEIAFYSKINLAKSYNVKTGDRKAIVKTLEKMLKDEKNTDFLDQIYYALAEFSLKEKNDTNAIKYLKLSVSTSTRNKYQKAISSLKLADIYFGISKYELAQAYYDSTMQFLPKDYPDYSVLKEKTSTLTNLVINLKTIEVEDSLQRLANMTEDERNKHIDQIIAEVKKEEQKKQDEQENAQENMPFFGQNDETQPNNNVSGSSWYFYNPAAVSFGYSEFVKKWGRRKLEDNWRLSNKKMIAYNFEENNKSQSDMMASDSMKYSTSNNNGRDKYLKDIPLNKKQLKESNSKISKALYNLGFIYYDGLKDTIKSVESFESILEKFPEDTVYSLKVYYQLYKLYALVNNQSKVDFYKNMILTKYPESDYAKIIINPNYNLELQAKKNKIASLYKETYHAFNREQYNMVVIFSNNAINNYKDKELIPKFEYLKALSIGKLENVDSLALALKKIIIKYPNSEVKPLAQNVLNHIYGKEVDVAKEQKTKEKEKEKIQKYSLYHYNPDTIHFYVLVVKEKNVNVNATKVKISDYNIKYNSLDNLSISSILMDNIRQMITVTSFKGKEKAMDYFNGIKNSKYIFSNIKSKDYKDFIISIDNYKTFYKDKNTDLYLKFFNKNYLNKKDK